jgi:predicted RND superfamily exporter protein
MLLDTGIPKTDKDVKALYDYLFSGAGISLPKTDSDFASFDINSVSMETKTVLYRDQSQYQATLIRVYIDSSLQTEDGGINDDLELLTQEMNEDLAEYGDANAIVTGNFIITLTITDSLTESQALSTGISIILAALVVIIAYRNPSLGLIAMIPVGVSIIWILGTMYFIGYSLNVLTIMVTSITIGIGIDYAIHATERFRLVADKTGDPEKAVSETISHTGGALLIAALTTGMGFGILAFAPMPPQQQFGIILAITITYSFLTSVIILPLVLAYWAKSRKKRRGFIISSPPENSNTYE